jgi:cytochrome bd-type quinol oxidase subunit 2
MPRRLIEILLALGLVGLATMLIHSVAGTMLTPGWTEAADARDWASMTLFLSVAAGLLLVAIRQVFRRDRSRRRVLRSTDWWAIATLSVIATACAAIASHWTIALPGLLPITIAVLLARRRAREERLAIVDAESPDLPPRATFTSGQPFGRPSGKS